MSSCIAVLGATGVYGRHLVPRLTAAGYRVRALVRRPDAAAIAAACGAEFATAVYSRSGDVKTYSSLMPSGSPKNTA
jgi:nucleoside-diphosphate-sugar epimerase